MQLFLPGHTQSRNTFLYNQHQKTGHLFCPLASVAHLWLFHWEEDPWSTSCCHFTSPNLENHLTYEKCTLLITTQPSFLNTIKGFCPQIFISYTNFSQSFICHHPPATVAAMLYLEAYPAYSCFRPLLQLFCPSAVLLSHIFIRLTLHFLQFSTQTSFEISPDHSI